MRGGGGGKGERKRREEGEGNRGNRMTVDWRPYPVGPGVSTKKLKRKEIFQKLYKIVSEVKVEESEEFCIIFVRQSLRLTRDR